MRGDPKFFQPRTFFRQPPALVRSNKERAPSAPRPLRARKPAARGAPPHSDFSRPGWPTPAARARQKHRLYRGIPRSADPQALSCDCPPRARSIPSRLGPELFPSFSRRHATISPPRPPYPERSVKELRYDGRTPRHKRCPPRPRLPRGSMPPRLASDETATTPDNTQPFDLPRRRSGRGPTARQPSCHP